MKHVGFLLTLLASSLSTANIALAKDSDCPVGYFCVWGDANYNGRYLFTSQAKANVGGHMNDLASSAWNRTNQTWCMYVDSDYRRAIGSYHPNARIPYIYMNDSMTSLRPC